MYPGSSHNSRTFKDLASSQRSAIEPRMDVLADQAAASGRNNFSISAYRVLYVLLVLMRRRTLSSSELITELYDNPIIHRMLNTETLTKYVNTLRSMGCAIPRVTANNEFRYELLTNPFAVTLEEQPWQVALMVLEWLRSDPFEERYHAYQTVIDKARWMMGETPSENPALRMVKTSEGLRHYRHQIRLFRKLCLENMALEVKYLPPSWIKPIPQVNEEAELATAPQEQLYYFEPHAVVQHARRWVLIGQGYRRNAPDQDNHATNTELSQPTDIPPMISENDLHSVSLDLEGIIWHRQLPYKNRRPSRMTSVVFKLTGRVAQTYRVYPNETIIARSATSDAITIRTASFDVEALLCRLLRYGPYCQVISPTAARQWMIQRIDMLSRTISNPS
ncbi:MAG: WYL domain-containing protein [Vampirovibrionales bacterium]|nr:WYL domain-containing protein [Vampirovibrionales bacterium]